VFGIMIIIAIIFVFVIYGKPSEIQARIAQAVVRKEEEGT
jgi:hypothetical protein